MKINNIEFNIHTQGTGLPFVWGHGLTGCMDFENQSSIVDWARIAEVVKLVRYDARGHGHSQPTSRQEDYYWSNLARDMVEIANHTGENQFSAGGQSMGCATALHAATLAPERIQALVLMNPPAAWEDRNKQSSIYEHLARLVEEHGVEYIVEMMKQRPLFSAWQLQAIPELNRNYLKTLQQFKATTLATILRGVGSECCNLPLRDELKLLRMPVLILAWGDDSAHPISTAEELSRLLPSSRLVVAHTMKEVYAWTQQIQDFLSMQPPLRSC